jgi:hypothetical protein
MRLVSLKGLNSGVHVTTLARCGIGSDNFNRPQSLEMTREKYACGALKKGGRQNGQSKNCLHGRSN